MGNVKIVFDDDAVLEFYVWDAFRDVPDFNAIQVRLTRPKS